MALEWSKASKVEYGEIEWNQIERNRMERNKKIKVEQNGRKLPRESEAKSEMEKKT